MLWPNVAVLPKILTSSHSNEAIELQACDPPPLDQSGGCSGFFVSID